MKKSIFALSLAISSSLLASPMKESNNNSDSPAAAKAAQVTGFYDKELKEFYSKEKIILTTTNLNLTDYQSQSINRAENHANRKKTEISQLMERFKANYLTKTEDLLNSAFRGQTIKHLSLLDQKHKSSTTKYEKFSQLVKREENFTLSDRWIGFYSGKCKTRQEQLNYAKLKITKWENLEKFFKMFPEENLKKDENQTLLTYATQKSIKWRKKLDKQERLEMFIEETSTTEKPSETSPVIVQILDY